MTIDVVDKAALDRLIERQQRAIYDIGDQMGEGAPATITARDVLQQLLVWQQTCTVTP